MKKTVSAKEATSRAGELLEGVIQHHDEVIIEEDGRQVAVVIPAYLYRSIERGREQLAELMQKSHERKEPQAEGVEPETAGVFANTAAESETAAEQAPEPSQIPAWLSRSSPAGSQRQESEAV
jgi:PHD/YefM family antitoxin component YafN of YafNO toxin-antitoxin module